MVKDKETHEEIVTAHRTPSETVTGEERQKIVTFRRGSIFGRVPFPPLSQVLKEIKMEFSFSEESSWMVSIGTHLTSIMLLVF